MDRKLTVSRHIKTERNVIKNKFLQSRDGKMARKYSTLLDFYRPLPSSLLQPQTTFQAKQLIFDAVTQEEH